LLFHGRVATPQNRKDGEVPKGKPVSPRVVDLFAGCGGLSLGFERAGWNVVFAADSWEAAVNCYRSNLTHPIAQIDLSQPTNLYDALADVAFDVIVGGPPCQDFSTAGTRVESKRADLTEAFAQIVCDLAPRAFVMENVPRTQKSAALARARQKFLARGYQIVEHVLDASFFGVPQARKRLFVVGMLDRDPNRFSEAIELQRTTKQMTVRDYFGDRLGTEHYYRHPRNYSRRGVYSIDEPSPTVRGVNRPVPPGYPGHPGDSAPIGPTVRPLTFQERAEVQTFPRTMHLNGTKSDLELLVGNAVPVNLASAVARALRTAIV
jgi:DNA (cytosine-5)-methyltransferase 1